MATNGASASDDNSDTINMDLMSTSMSGNLSFDVVLLPPRAVHATPRASKILASPTTKDAPISLDAITTKMKTAEENRGRRLDEKLEKN